MAEKAVLPAKQVEWRKDFYLPSERKFLICAAFFSRPWLPRLLAKPAAHLGQSPGHEVRPASASPLPLAPARFSANAVMGSVAAGKQGGLRWQLMTPFLTPAGFPEGSLSLLLCHVPRRQAQRSQRACPSHLPVWPSDLFRFLFSKLS